MKLAIIHTTPATIDTMKALAGQTLPGWQVINFVDDSILPQLAENGGDVSQVEERLVAYARFAQDAGADILLEACSSVGEVVEKMRQAVSIPVVRIDEAMAEAAVGRAATGQWRSDASHGNLPSMRKIGVAATLATTLNPTMRLIQAKAGQAGVQVELMPVLADAAYRKLMEGDKEGHDAILVEALTKLSARADVVVLAQASMARVLPQLPRGEQDKFLSSPKIAIQRVRDLSQKLGKLENGPFLRPNAGQG